MTCEEKLSELAKLDAELHELSSKADQSLHGSVAQEMAKRAEYNKCLTELHELQTKEAIAQDVAAGR